MTRTLDETIASLRQKIARAEPRLELGPPMTAAALESVETRLGMQLPEDFRRFLLEIGDGCRGPSYYLYSLEEMLAESTKSIYTLADPFEPPLSVDEWVDRDAPGMLLTNHEGCAFFSGLVLSGNERGTMWSFIEVGPGWIPHAADIRALVNADGTPFVPATGWGDDAYYAALHDNLLAARNRHLRLRFVDWFERLWVDRLLAEE